MSAVAVEGVWKFYGDYPALRDIRLAAEPGSCLALIGRNGAGKTTLLRIMAGFSRPMRGKIRILGMSRARPPRGVEWALSAMASRSTTSFRRWKTWCYSASYTACPIRAGRLWNGSSVPAWSACATAWSASFARHAAATGGRARVPARSRGAAAGRTFTALDDRAIAVLQSLLRDALAAGKTVVMSTHQLREALELASHVALLTRGKVRFQGERTRK